MNRQPVLVGERLRLRPLEADDWQAMFAVASDRELWARHPSHDRWQEPVFRAFFDDALEKGGALAIIEKETDRLIGSSRFQKHDPANGGVVEIGWTFLARDRWGTGLNAEAKRLMLDHAFGYVARVVFSVGADNVISRRAMAKVGGRLTGETWTEERAGVPTEHVRFEITREDFSRGPLTSSSRGA